MSREELTKRGKSKSELVNIQRQHIDKYPKMNVVILLVNVNVFLYAVCWMIQANTLPYLTKTLGADTVTFGYIQSVFSVIQLIGGLVFGRIGDVFGSHLTFMMAFIAASAYYGILAISNSIPLVFLSCLPSVFMHAMQGGTMVVTDFTTQENRASALGKLWLFYSIGCVIGPFLGGYISTHHSNQTAAAFACAGSILSILLVSCFMPNVSKKEPQSPQPDDDNSTQISEQTNGIFHMSKMLSVIQLPGVGVLLLAKILIGFPSSVFAIMFPVVTMNTFNYSATDNGYWQSYVSILMMTFQGFIVGYLTKRVNEYTLLKCCFFIFIWSYMFMSFCDSVVMIVIAISPVIGGMALCQVVISSMLTKLVPSADTGMVLAFSMACDAFVGALAPIAGGFLLNKYDYHSFGCLGAVASMVTFSISLFYKDFSEK